MERTFTYHAVSLLLWGMLWLALMSVGLLPDFDSFTELFNWKIIAAFVLGVIVNFIGMKCLAGFLNISERSQPYIYLFVDYLGFFTIFVVLLKVFGV